MNLFDKIREEEEEETGVNGALIAILFILGIFFIVLSIFT